MSYKITDEQLDFLTEYARCGLATNGRDRNPLWEMVKDIKANKIIHAPKLVVGNKYILVRSGESFPDVDGSEVVFEDKIYNVEILPKPEKVVAFDGVDEEEVFLPEHLKSDSWYAVLNLDTNRKHWMNVDGMKIEEV